MKLGFLWLFLALDSSQVISGSHAANTVFVTAGPIVKTKLYVLTILRHGLPILKSELQLHILFNLIHNYIHNVG